MSLQGTYIDITEIGSGGGGTVFRAFQTRMKKYVVLKKIHDNIRENTDIRGELDILKNLRHEYLPTVLDFIEDEGSVYTVMDYIPGESFESLLYRGVRFTQAQVEKYAAQLGQVLSYLHSQRPPIVHGDVKPANLMLTPEDNICLIDFNISQLQNGVISRNMGYTPGFASPEQGRIVQAMRQFYAGQPYNLSERMDVRSDIYSAGATLYAIFSGVAPSEDFSQIMPIETLMPDCSEGLAYLIRKSMQLRPEDRFQSAAEFSRAVAGIAKMDKRYKHLVLRQNLAAVGCIFGLTACIILAILGKGQIGTERSDAYRELIEQMEDLRAESGQEERLEELYNEAVEAFPDEADAYYQMAAGLYEKREYEGLKRFIRREVLDHVDSFSDEETAVFYFLLASADLELDDLESALTYYRTAIKYDAYDSAYYADYAIALARSGSLEKAREILESAAEMGVSNDRMLLAQGEIAARQGSVEEAADFFSQCVAETGDSYITLRAYVMWGKAYDGRPDEAGLLQKAAVLTQGVEAVKDSDRAVLLEQLAQSYIDLGALTFNNEYNEQAIRCLQKIADMGWGTYVTHSNIGILYQTIGDYELALQQFSAMLEQYGEDYRTYKRLAFLEADIQSARANADRDYGRFADYYGKARKLFEDSNVRSDSDMEMKMLEQVYAQLKAGNWLD